MSTENVNIAEALSEPFEPEEIKWKPQVVKNDKAMMIAYVDARVVEDRLDDVFGVDGWEDSYTLLPNGSVCCVLRIRVGAAWIEKSDVGSQSDQPDEGDRLKSAFSDALKRAAVKLGIGRYLYRLPSQWVPYDAQKRRPVQMPVVPAWARPKVKSVTITSAQWDQLKAALITSHIVQRKFLDHFHISRPGELPTAKFDEAMRLAKAPKPEWLKVEETDATEQPPVAAPVPVPTVNASATKPTPLQAAQQNGNGHKPADKPDLSHLPKDQEGRPMATSSAPTKISKEEWLNVLSLVKSNGISQAKLLHKYQLKKPSDCTTATLPVILSDVRNPGADILLDPVPETVPWDDQPDDETPID